VDEAEKLLPTVKASFQPIDDSPGLTGPAFKVKRHIRVNEAAFPYGR